MTLDLPTSTVTWNGLTLGSGTPWIVTDPGIVGWEESTPIDKLSEPRADSYGDRDTPLRARGRTVQIAGLVKSTDQRDVLVRQFLQAMTLPADPRAKGELSITTAGRTLMAYAQVAGRKIMQGKYWGIGRFGWAVQFICDDYLRYGSEIVAEAPLNVVGGGITVPLTAPITLPFRPKSGVADVFNPGDRLTPAVFELWGPQVGLIGVQQVTTGRTLTYDVQLAAGSGTFPPDRLVIDTRAGWATLNGDASRSALPGSSVTRAVGLIPGINQIRATGTTPGGGTAKLVVRFRPASE